MMVADFTSEPFDAFQRYIHQSLRAGNLFLKARGVDRVHLFQRQQPDIDSQQSLGDFIL